jgi:hypothetical protein
LEGSFLKRSLYSQFGQFWRKAPSTGNESVIIERNLSFTPDSSFSTSKITGDKKLQPD